MKKIMLLVDGYPSADNIYANGFVHTRVKEYVKYTDVHVVVFNSNKPDYSYEGIAIRNVSNTEELWKEYHSYNPQAIFIHFYHRELFALISGIEIPVSIWVHGYEALGWYRRLFNYTPKSLLRQLPRLVKENLVQMNGFRKIIGLSNAGKRIHFVFVSNWMKKICEADSFFASIKNYSLIPNPIDIHLFRYREKDREMRKRILMIRSFGSKKYANDIAINAIRKLREKPFFEDLTFSIYGRGKYFAELTAPISGLKNVSLNETFVENSSIPEIHKEYGIFLCPTRQDAQGVSMCEAMASGLVPLSSFSTAIPEFIDDGVSGILNRNANQIAENIERLYHNPDQFAEISVNASESIRKKCYIDKIVQQELSIGGINTLYH
jgi:L-malate glycosyltransferase